MQTELVEIACEDRTDRLVADMVALWRASVEATHAFLTPPEIDAIEAYVPDAIRAVPLLEVAMAGGGRPVGFAGIDGDMLEMLFVAPDLRGRGVGSLLLDRAFARGVRRVDVNEQNPQARGFYEHKGFRVVGRSELDGQGAPYPILHMALVEYRILSEPEIDRSLFARFVRRQVVVDCWRKVDGVWMVEPDPFVDDWSEADYQTLVACLKNTAATGGFVCGAFVAGALKGFASVEPGLFGGDRGYLDLSSLHVSEDVRGCGIGTELFRRAADWARRAGARKLYISAHSAVETQAFYRAMGCVEAQEYDMRHVEREPFDCQLECEL